MLATTVDAKIRYESMRLMRLALWLVSLHGVFSANVIFIDAINKVRETELLQDVHRSVRTTTRYAVQH